MAFHTHIQLAGTVTLGPKGQVVIPVEVREDMGIQPGDKLVALYAPDKKSIGFITENHAQAFVDMMGKSKAHFDKMHDTKPHNGMPEGWD